MAISYTLFKTIVLGEVNSTEVHFLYRYTLLGSTMADEEDEMPVLFMDSLPADFAANAQLAAIATFMQSDEEQSAAEIDPRPQSQRQRRSRHRRRKQQPYSRETSRSAPKETTTQELQLFLSMMQVGARDSASTQ